MDEMAQTVDEMSERAETFFDMAIDWLKDFLPHLVGAIVILILGMAIAGWVSNIISKAMKKAKISTEVVTFVHSFIKIALKSVVVVAVIGTLGFNVASLVTALGAATVAVGLALQDTLKNIASGLMVLINKPFKVDDYVSIGGFEGRVTKIDISNTHLLTTDNKEVIIPNANLTSGNITNYSSQEKRKVILNYGVAYGTDIEKVKKVIDGVIADSDKILGEPERFFGVGKHGDSSIEIVVKVWCKTPDYWNVYYYMQENVLKAFEKNHIQIPFPQIDVHS